MKDFENSLDTMLEKALLTISNGVDDAKSYFHTPTVCTFEGQEISARTVHAYDQEEKIQIRLKGSIEVHHQDSVTEKAWENTREMSKECYSVKDSPSKKIDNPIEFDIDKNQIDREMGYENFAVNLFTFQSLEILYLKRAGHRRAIFEWLNNDVKKNWLIP